MFRALIEETRRELSEISRLTRLQSWDADRKSKESHRKAVDHFRHRDPQRLPKGHGGAEKDAKKAEKAANLALKVNKSKADKGVARMRGTNARMRANDLATLRDRVNESSQSGGSKPRRVDGQGFSWEGRHTSPTEKKSQLKRLQKRLRQQGKKMAKQQDEAKKK